MEILTQLGLTPDELIQVLWISGALVAGLVILRAVVQVTAKLMRVGCVTIGLIALAMLVLNMMNGV